MFYAFSLSKYIYGHKERKQGGIAWGWNGDQKGDRHSNHSQCPQPAPLFCAGVWERGRMEPVKESAWALKPDFPGKGVKPWYLPTEWTHVHTHTQGFIQTLIKKSFGWWICKIFKVEIQKIALHFDLHFIVSSFIESLICFNNLNIL